MDFPLEATIRGKRAVALVLLNQHACNLGSHRIRFSNQCVCIFVDSHNQIISLKIKIIEFTIGDILKKMKKKVGL